VLPRDFTACAAIAAFTRTADRGDDDTKIDFHPTSVGSATNYNGKTNVQVRLAARAE